MKKIIFFINIVFITLFITGCNTAKFPLEVYIDENLKREYKTIRNPELNKIATVEIGQNMYYKSYLIYDNTFDVTLLEPAIGKEGYSWVDSSNNIPTSESQFTYLTYKNDSLKKLRKTHQNKNAMCYTHNICLVDTNNQNEFTHFSDFGYETYGLLDNPVKYNIERTVFWTGNSFKYEALYQGKKGNSIKISFREFKDNIARPAFTQDIDYELNQNKPTIIGFKGLRIEVLKATNYDITFKVIKDYN